VDDRDGVRVVALARPPVNAVNLAVVEAVLSGRIFAPGDAPAARIFDALLPAERLIAAAVEQAAEMATASAYAAVKRQLRAEAVARLERIVAHDGDPLLRGWF